MEPELERVFDTVSAYFALLAEPTRLKILNALCDGERSVNDVVERVSSTQTNVSRHLNLMYSRGVLTRRREGAMTLYSIADETVVALCRTACVQIASLADGKAIPSKAVRRFMAAS
ncbi:MAG TPA: metalloregulator ArsR/SmtB family transcription factor [Burkholderiaceae bacterium]|jgi:DNA-binding transcriptional ArsR family regulator|nr:metalloregulator ArsR/SmtB family transcription factor [Burkholderiaceae bacterium]